MTSNDDLQARKDEADVVKAEAEARKAEADATKAHADARKAETDADKEAAAARRDQVTALVPDLTKVKESTLDVKDSTPMWATFLTFGALRKVAADVAATMLASRSGDGNWRVLLTSEPNLASSDAVYREIMTGLSQLVSAADKLLEEVEERVFVEAAAALAAALPGLLSLFSAQRTVSTAATTVGDLAATAAVAGALKHQAPEVAIVHDDFRLIPEGVVHTATNDVAQRRQQLVAKKLELADTKSNADAALAEAKAKKPRDEAEIARLTRDSVDCAVRVGLVDSVIAAIDTFMAAIRTVPQGATLSPLATAALRDVLHGQPSRFTHILLVKGQAGQAQQQLENRPLFFKDRFSTNADISVTYMFIATGSSEIVDSGTITGTATARGKIGDRPTVDVSVVGG